MCTKNAAQNLYFAICGDFGPPRHHLKNAVLNHARIDLAAIDLTQIEKFTFFFFKNPKKHKLQ